MSCNWCGQPLHLSACSIEWRRVWSDLAIQAAEERLGRPLDDTERLAKYEDATDDPCDDCVCGSTGLRKTWDSDEADVDTEEDVSEPEEEDVSESEEEATAKRVCVAK